MEAGGDKQFYDSYYGDKDFTDKSDYKISDGLDVEGKKILSLGCGTCEDLHYLLDKNEVWGVDVSSTAVEKARRAGVKARLANLEEDLDFPDRGFEIVICKDVIEHLLKPDRLLREIRRVLSDDGVLVLNVPNQFYWLFRLRILFGGNMIWKTYFHDHTKDFNEWDYMHIRFFTYRGLLKLLGLCGFEVQKPFWDFGSLAHYADPDRLTKNFRKDLYSGKNELPRWKRLIIVEMLFPVYRIANFIFPRKVRSRFVSLNPGLLCASFYLRCVKSSIDARD